MPTFVGIARRPCMPLPRRGRPCRATAPVQGPLAISRAALDGVAPPLSPKKTPLPRRETDRLPAEPQLRTRLYSGVLDVRRYGSASDQFGRHGQNADPDRIGLATRL